MAAISEHVHIRDAALAAATNGIVIVDALEDDHPIVYVNAGFERLTGYTADEVLGRNCRFLQGEETAPATRDAFRRVLAEHRSDRVLVRNHRKDGSAFWNEVVLSPVLDEGRLTHYVGVQLDVTERVVAEERASFLADHDPLTGLPNRRRLQQDLIRRCREADEQGSQLALLYLDVDDFKAINDRWGHAAGDDLLRQLTERLQAAVRPGDLLARQGGDEFAVVIAAPSDGLGAGARVADRILAELRPPVVVSGEIVQARVSVGVSAYPADACSPAELLQHADAAMYAAKGIGGGARRVYAGSGRARAESRPPVVVTVTPASGPRELAAILDAGAIRSLYQPIVALDTGASIGYEALARGPEGSTLERPDLLFAAARDCGRLGELDWACRAAAVRGALDGGLRPPTTLFVNVEPGTIAAPPPPAIEPLMAEARSRLHVVLELTERALGARPADVLAAVPRLRALGYAIALDDVGTDPRSLALMPFLRPEVIKLDLRLVQDEPTPMLASIVHAVNAEAERSGALLLAEGVETAAHEQTALALGARFGQGWRYGRPGALPAQPAAEPFGARRIAPRPPDSLTRDTPFGVVSAHQAPRRGTKRLLYAISKQLEARVVSGSDAAVLLATFQEARHFTGPTRARYRRLAQSASFVGALGVGLPPEPLPGVRGADLGEAEPLRGEWNVVVVDPHFAAAFVARDLGDEGVEDWDRRFEFCLTYDRALAVEAARAMMSRVAPSLDG
jgi:diguanylate cyclase (GGDEF)-like protein/PAS domain S-box-containing protein